MLHVSDKSVISTPEFRYHSKLQINKQTQIAEINLREFKHLNDISTNQRKTQVGKFSSHQIKMKDPNPKTGKTQIPKTFRRS